MLPGLFDMHGHVGRWDGGAATSPPASPPCATWATTTRRCSRCSTTSPPAACWCRRSCPAGFLEGESPFSARIGFVDQDAGRGEAGDRLVRRARLPAAEDLQLVPEGDPARDRRLRARARHARQRPRAGVPARAGSRRAGFDEIQHINQVMLNFLVTPETDTRTLERFILPAEKVGGLDFDCEAGAGLHRACWRAGRSSIDPTLATFDFIRQRDGEMSPAFAAVADHMPPDVQRSLLRRRDEDSRRRHRRRATQRSYAKMVEFVGRLYRAGVPIVAGTDDSPASRCSANSSSTSRPGMTPAQALQVATRNGAKYARTSPTAAASRRASSPTSCWSTAIRRRTSPTSARSRW